MSQHVVASPTVAGRGNYVATRCGKPDGGGAREIKCMFDTNVRVTRRYVEQYTGLQ